jgi:hypothetical protein
VEEEVMTKGRMGREEHEGRRGERESKREGEAKVGMKRQRYRRLRSLKSFSEVMGVAIVSR